MFAKEPVKTRVTVTTVAMWELANPHDYVMSGHITEDSEGVFWASITTKHGHISDYFHTLLGAKQTIGRNIQAGGIWKKVPVPEN